MSGVSFGDGIRDKIIMAESDFFFIPYRAGGIHRKALFPYGKESLPHWCEDPVWQISTGPNFSDTQEHCEILKKESTNV